MAIKGFNHKLPHQVSIQLEKISPKDSLQESVFSFIKTLKGQQLIDVIAWCLCGNNKILQRYITETNVVSILANAACGLTVEDIKKFESQLRFAVGDKEAELVEYAIQVRKREKVKERKEPLKKNKRKKVSEGVPEALEVEEFLPAQTSTFAPVQLAPRERRQEKTYFLRGEDFSRALEEIESDTQSEDIFTGLFRLLRFQERHLESLMKRFMERDRDVRDKDIVDAADSVRKIYDTIGKYQVAADMIVRASERVNVQIGNTYNQYVQTIGDERDSVANVTDRLIDFMKKRALTAGKESVVIDCECEVVDE